MIQRNGVSPPPAAPIGEVIESTTTDFVAQAATLGEAPDFGAFVHVAADQGITIIGVVAQVQTAGIDPGARPIMRCHGEVRDDLIYQENPDLPHVLRTTFRALVTGFQEGRTWHQFLPPRPPRLHYSVWTSPPAQVRHFTDAGLDYLRTLLLATAEAPADELLAANIRLTAASHAEHADQSRFTHAAGRELAQLLRADYERLNGILRRVFAGPLA
jgi:hypothetical protein